MRREKQLLFHARLVNKITEFDLNNDFMKGIKRKGKYSYQRYLVAPRNIVGKRLFNFEVCC